MMGESLGAIRRELAGAEVLRPLLLADLAEGVRSVVAGDRITAPRWGRPGAEDVGYVVAGAPFVSVDTRELCVSAYPACCRSRGNCGGCGPCPPEVLPLAVVASCARHDAEG